jgi:hypothetical protein
VKKFSVVLLLIAVPVVLLLRWVRHEARAAQTEDVVTMAAGAVHELYLKNPSPSSDEINRAIFGLQSSGVTSIQVGPDGRPADPYRTTLRIHHEVKGRQLITTVTSAGADREFDTKDDVRHVVTSDLPGKP